MSTSFTFSANAKQFIPHTPRGYKRVEINGQDLLADKKTKRVYSGDLEELILVHESGQHVRASVAQQAEYKKKRRCDKMLADVKAEEADWKKKYDKLRRNYKREINELTLENERLNNNLRRMNTKLLEERVDRQGLEGVVCRHQETIDRLKIDLLHKDENYDALHQRFVYLNRECRERGDPEMWIGRWLKLDFILKKIEQIGALPEDHGAWVWDMVEDIEFPDGIGDSVFLSLPAGIRERYLPSHSDAEIDFNDDESSIIQELSREAGDFNTNLSEHFLRNLDENPEITLNHIRTIQSRVRDFIRPMHESQTTREPSLVEESDDDDARMMLAIQLSLVQTSE